MRALALASLLLACSSGRTLEPAHSAPTPPSATSTVAKPSASASAAAGLYPLSTKAKVIARVPAFDARADGDRVFVLDPKIERLSAYDLVTGSASWSAAIGVEPSGRLGFYPAWGTDKRVLLHVQNHLIRFAPDTGARLSDVIGLWSQDKTRYGETRGACTFSNDSTLQFVDCTDARAVGSALRIAETHLYAKLGAPHDTVYWGPRFVLGRAGSVLVAVTDGRTLEPMNDGPTTLGIDAKSGNVLWSKPGFGCSHCSSAGASSDGATCWLASTDGTLDVFDCATGKARYQKKLDPADSRPEIFTTWVPKGILVSTESKAMVLDAKSGNAVWSRSLWTQSLALPLATRLELDAFSTWQKRTIHLVAPTDGKTVTKFELPGYTELRQDSDLGLHVEGGVAFDPKGAPRSLPKSAPRFTLEREKAPATLRDGATVLATVTTDLAIVAQKDDTVVLFVWPAQKMAPGEVVFLRP